MTKTNKQLVKLFTTEQLQILRNMYKTYVKQPLYYTTLLQTIRNMLYENYQYCNYKMCNKVYTLLKKDYQS